jgi:hypothetical protein
MEIGGKDLVFNHPGMVINSDYLITICRSVWNTLVVEFDPEPGHFYVYRDMNAAILWHKDVPDGPAPMIYFIMEESMFTAVIDSEDEDTKKVVEVINKVFSPFKEIEDASSQGTC